MTSAKTDTYTSGYGWRSSDVLDMSRRLNERMADIIGRLGGERVLDLGSGNGHLCGLLAARGMKVVGVERDLMGVKFARQTYPLATFIEAPIAEVPERCEPRSFDVVISSQVVEHLYAPSEVPIVAHRMLKDNGEIVVSTPYHGFLKNLALSLTNTWDRHHDALREGGHVKFWSRRRRTIERLLESHGFRAHAFEGFGLIPLLWKTMIVTAKRVNR